MTIIQAHRRTKNHDVHFTHVTLKFKPNEQGHVICDVKDQKLVDRLLDIPTGFRLYGEQPELPVSPVLTKPVTLAELAKHPIEQQELPPALKITPPAGEIPTEQKPAGEIPTDEQHPSSQYVLIAPSGDQYDLRPLDDATLHAFAAANDIKVHPNAKGNTIRDKIVAFFLKTAE